ncbi:unnamed protein product [Merluccius merluccius]
MRGVVRYLDTSWGLITPRLGHPDVTKVDNKCLGQRLQRTSSTDNSLRNKLEQTRTLQQTIITQRYHHHHTSITQRYHHHHHTSISQRNEELHQTMVKVGQLCEELDCVKHHMTKGELPVEKVSGGPGA